MDAIWLSFPVGSAIALVLAYASYRLIPWRKRAEATRVPPTREPAVA
jgi:Na+-driven multidrug efflux pump